MKQSELLEMLDFFNKSRVWIFNIHMVKTYFSSENENSIRISLSRHIKNGIILRIAKGIYVNPRSRYIPMFRLEHIASYIRNFRTIYLSFESVLSECGLISQIPMRLTFISKEKSAVFDTPYGIIEYTKTNKDFNLYGNKFYFSKERNIFIATPEQALDDAYRFNRNINLIKEQRKKNDE